MVRATKPATTGGPGRARLFSAALAAALAVGGGALAAVLSGGGPAVAGEASPAVPLRSHAAAVTPLGGAGYWLAGADGGVFTEGDAGFYGSAGGTALVAPVVGMAATPDGKGYWLVAADGGVFAYGDAGFYGSASPWVALAGTKAVGIVATADGMGYWATAADGSVFSYGDAPEPSGYGIAAAPVVAASGSPDLSGLRMAESDGAVLCAGAPSPCAGTAGPLAAPVVGMATYTAGPVPFLSYGPSPAERALVYASASAGSPLVVLVHGGGFDGGSAADADVPDEAAWLQSEGVSVVSLDYDLAGPAATAFPLQPDEVAAAASWAEENAPAFDASTSDLVLFGGSAGGTDAALAASSVRPAAVIDLSGVDDMASFVAGLVDRTDPGWALLLAPMQEALGCPVLSFCSSSVESAASPDTAPYAGARWLVAESTGDPLVQPAQSEALGAALAAAGASLDLQIVSGDGHAFALDGQLASQILATVYGSAPEPSRR